MGDFVGVDPQLLHQLADRLHDLAGVLAKEAPAIASAMQYQDHSLDLSILDQVKTRSGEDSPTLVKRADLAMELQQQTVPGFGLNADAVFAPNAAQPPNFVSLGPGPNQVEVPWDTTDQEYAVEAGADASRLQAAIAKAKDPGSTDTIAQVGQLLSDHLDDPTYMQAFFAAGGLSSAQQVARALHSVDGTKNDQQVLSQNSQQILALYGNAVASATNLQAQNKITSLDINGLKNPPNGDVWSEGMLFKYGPSGTAWEPGALAAVSGAMLDWRKQNQVRPDYTKPTGGAAGGFKDPDNPWYGSLGLAVDVDSHNATPEVLAARLAGMQENDPSLALMQRLSENPVAARDLLGGNDDASRGYAHDLVNDKWATPLQAFGSKDPTASDDSLFPAKVLAAATMDRTSSPAIEALSAQAAANIFQAGADNYDNPGLKGNEKDVYQGLPENLSMALANIGTGYAADLAQATKQPGDPAAHFYPYQNDGMTMVSAGTDTMKSFLAEIMSNKDAGDKFKDGINQQISAVASNVPVLTKDMSDADQAAVLLSQQNATTFITNLGELRGRLAVAQSLPEWQTATAADKAAAAASGPTADGNMWINAVGGFVASIPTGWEFMSTKQVITADFVKASIWGALPVATSTGGILGDPGGTDNAAQWNEKVQPIMFKDQQDLMVPILQGLLDKGVIAPIPGDRATTGGRLTPGDPNLLQLWGEATQKNAYYGTLLTSLQQGFIFGAPVYATH